MAYSVAVHSRANRAKCSYYTVLHQTAQTHSLHIYSCTVSLQIHSPQQKKHAGIIYIHRMLPIQEPRRAACIRVVRPINFWSWSSGRASCYRLVVPPNANSTTAMDSTGFFLPEIPKQQERVGDERHMLQPCLPARQLPCFLPAVLAFSNRKQLLPAKCFPPAL